MKLKKVSSWAEGDASGGPANPLKNGLYCPSIPVSTAPGPCPVLGGALFTPLSSSAPDWTHEQHDRSSDWWQQHVCWIRWPTARTSFHIDGN